MPPPRDPRRGSPRFFAGSMHVLPFGALKWSQSRHRAACGSSASLSRLVAAGGGTRRVQRVGLQEMVHVTAGTSGARDGVLNADWRLVRRGVAVRGSDRLAAGGTLPRGT